MEGKCRPAGTTTRYPHCEGCHRRGRPRSEERLVYADRMNSTTRALLARRLPSCASPKGRKARLREGKGREQRERGRERTRKSMEGKGRWQLQSVKVILPAAHRRPIGSKPCVSQHDTSDRAYAQSWLVYAAARRRRELRRAPASSPFRTPRSPPSSSRAP